MEVQNIMSSISKMVVTGFTSVGAQAVVNSTRNHTLVSYSDGSQPGTWHYLPFPGAACIEEFTQGNDVPELIYNMALTFGSFTVLRWINILWFMPAQHVIQNASNIQDFWKRRD